MTDMLTGVLRMPLPDEPAEIDIVTWLQVRDRMREAADEIERLRHAAQPFAIAYDIAKRELGMADINHLDAIAKLYVQLKDFKAINAAMQPTETTNYSKDHLGDQLGD